MLPTYASGDIVLGWRWFAPRVGQVVAARTDHPVIKRVVAVSSAGFELMGDNPTSSAYRGVQPDQIEALMVVRLSKVRSVTNV